MYELPHDPKKIRATIRRYERKFRPWNDGDLSYGDDMGTRYLLAPFYLMLGDVDGAIASLEWYERVLPDDCVEPGHHLCWALALHRAGQARKSIWKLAQTMLSNLYVLPHLLDAPRPELDFDPGSDSEWESYLEYIPREFFELWNPEEIAWATSSDCQKTDKPTNPCQA